jgi:hypothetical protein
MAFDAGAVCGGLCELWQASELQPNETLAEEDWGWMEHRGIDESTPREVQYATAYYWAITVLSTVGYGDISAHTPAEMMVSGVAELVGCFLFAMLIGSIGGEQRAQTPTTVSACRPHVWSTNRAAIDPPCLVERHRHSG